MRPDLDWTMLKIAATLAERGTCAKLQVGCVLTDDYGRILSTGYNGVPIGCEHCIEKPCPGATTPRGSDACQAVHAESNALLQCRDVDRIYTCYVTHAPCLRCTKTLMNTACSRIVFLDNSLEEPAAKGLWTSERPEWLHYSTKQDENDRF